MYKYRRIKACFVLEKRGVVMFQKCIGIKRFWTKIISGAVLIATLNIFVLSSFVMADFSSTQASKLYKDTTVDNITSKAYALGNAIS